MPRLALCALAAVALSASTPVPPPSAPAVRWGEHGHRLVGRAAADALPDSMPAFFRDAAAQLSYLNPEPDRWRDRTERDLDRAMDAAHAPEHYIDLELVPAGVLDAPDRLAFADSLAAHGGDAKTAGVLPYQILELTQRIRVGFRNWRAAESDEERAYIEERIVNDAGILGHYVADGSNPHHTTIHYNGWAGDDGRFATLERGFHGRFESAYVEANVSLGDVEAALTAPARDLGPLRPAVWSYVADTHALVERLYELDEVETFGPDTQGADHKAFAVDRLAAGAAMLRDLWWTAWVTSAE
ncbi:nuclease [Rubrivirga marina]|uniref:nuclease n=1 Tax=Rubrivirga marina TaxID=1196024 RepID=UPI000BA9B906|nr:nuclease [Rubrivirga marina]